MFLPKDFIEKYQKILGSESDDFLKTFDDSAVSAYRTNPLKKAQKDFSDAIPGTPWGHYGKVSGKSAEHVTGLVYSQEPAAQMVAQVAAPEKGMKVLDLAAAPGGKTTQLLSYLDNTGLLVSNEISKKRSKILVENVERFGAQNVLVTNESSQKLAKVFKSYFDLIVFDGPCSGEGMFRKDPDAVQYWHKAYPAECASLQKEILEEAMKMLAPGGRLIYSTCTWAPEENEEVVAWLLENYPDLSLLNIPKINGMQEGIDMPEVARMYPHHFKGEGQFVAHLQDRRQPETKKIKAGKSNLRKDQTKLWQDFAKKHLKRELSGFYQTFGDELYLLPEGLPDLSKLKIARNGLHLGTFKKNRFEPSFALGIALSSDDVYQGLELTADQFAAYTSGNIVQLDQTFPNGWYQIRVDGNGLGFAKIVGNTVKNYYPKGLRFNS
ncbi:RsmF rRNA methyltransferase first C-terminal domain-containing protein [Streptococcus loxodontisalivarius]|uniref:NOL1/NOP2/sun family putative RNA methylase n=1 Tax=Streptococcus loxodontisalivarius TaxID=1349415 RepID=A0ABS2PR38_9STRE|nr:RsmB/NOP family class I SAM-dependent RNA methyltransferase [Streptococcus loxodontisalivarius]MBM7641842.1 NOL1/NOP2/sun family putative RNA methylase [Streptococcus loxodontisalivarius]